MVKEDIQTVIDRLSDYITAGGSVSLKDASKAVARKPAQVERFALLLEEAGIIEVRYSLSGVKLVAKKKPTAPDTASEKASRTESTTDADRLEREVLTSENLLKFFESDIERRINISEALLKDLETREGFTVDELNHLKSEVDLALRQLESFTDEVRKLGERERDFHDKLKEFRSRIDHMQARAEPTRRGGSVIAALTSALDSFLDLIFGKPGSKAKPPTGQVLPPTKPTSADSSAPKLDGAKTEAPKAEAIAVAVKPPQSTPPAPGAIAAPRKFSLPYAPSGRPASRVGGRKKFVIKRRR